MNLIRQLHPIRRAAAIVAGLAGALLASLAVAQAALATPPVTSGPYTGPGFISPSPAMTYTVPVGGTPGTPLISPPPSVTDSVITGGMPGWQITLIAVASAVAAATLAVIVDRARATRRRLTAPAA